MPPPENLGFLEAQISYFLQLFEEFSTFSPPNTGAGYFFPVC
jgi:hypothetical protein